MIGVNFKQYAGGEKALDLARICRTVARQSRVRVVALPQVADLAGCVKTGVECWTQYYDPAARGHKGTLLNHSDYPLSWEQLTSQLQMAKDQKLIVCVCAASAPQATRVATLAPDFVAYEPPQLIGSRDKSVSSARPQTVKRLVEQVNVPLLVGAGIHSAADVRVGRQLGARGFLVATDVVLAADPARQLQELAEAFR